MSRGRGELMGATLGLSVWGGVMAPGTSRRPLTHTHTHTCACRHAYIYIHLHAHTQRHAYMHGDKFLAPSVVGCDVLKNSTPLTPLTTPTPPQRAAVHRTKHYRGNTHASRFRGLHGIQNIFGQRLNLRKTAQSAFLIGFFCVSVLSFSCFVM